MRTENIEELIGDIIELVDRAGDAIMEVYRGVDFGTERKDDNSPLTEADLASHGILVNGLEELTPDIPVLSEESQGIEYAERKQWERFWLVDPLDGTKEFIKQNGEFTVNVALIENGTPVAGVVGVPALENLYWAAEGEGAFKRLTTGEMAPVEVADAPSADTEVVVVVSRSHVNDETRAFADAVADRYDDVDLMPVGSALKLCMVAEGNAQVYPRLGPTMEWDIAAAHCVVEQAGGVIRTDGGERLLYNKENLRNPFFVAACCEELLEA